MKQVVIIGAGPAGLTAGYELLKKGQYTVTILEASPDIGGISRTATYHGNRMDLGGHRFFSKNDRVMDWWLQQLPLQGKPAQDDQALGLVRDWSPNGPDPEQTDRVMLLRQRISRIYYLRRFFDYPISLKWNYPAQHGFPADYPGRFQLYRLHDPQAAGVLLWKIFISIVSGKCCTACSSKTIPKRSGAGIRLKSRPTGEPSVLKVFPSGPFSVICSDV